MNRSAPITAELRKWRKISTEYVSGKVYDDRTDTYEDGEEGTIGPITDWYESVNFFLITTLHHVYKLSKEERAIGDTDEGKGSSS